MQSEHNFIKLNTNSMFIFISKENRIFLLITGNSYYFVVTDLRNDHNNILVIIMGWIIHCHCILIVYFKIK